MEPEDNDNLTPTLSPPEDVTQNASRAWGKLLSTYIYLSAVELSKPTFCFGRATGCDVEITGQNFPVRKKSIVSKRHFEIKKDNSAVYIKDLSKNGTFVNNKLLGKDNIVMLQNNDEISVGSEAMKIYVFKYDDFLPSELHEKFQLDRLLGKGAFGEVRLVTCNTTNRKFAVKKISIESQCSQDKNSRDKIDTEMKILQALKHPAIVAMEQIVETQSAVFFVLEFMEGGELKDFIETTLLSEQQVKFLFYQMSLAVDYLHDMGITHRDLKPQNILLKAKRADTLVKITDFGLSKIRNHDSIMKTFCGTPCFIAPEMITQPHSYTKKVDVWSLGVILYFMLSQNLPFMGKTYQKVLYMIMHSDYPTNEEIWCKVSTNVKNLLAKLLTKNPNQRITMKDVLKMPWIKCDTKMQFKAKRMMYDFFDSSSSDCDSTLMLKRAKIAL